jgi:glycosyltransferase involved in cell wall biosynthesis
MTAAEPLISVIVTTYNHEKYIAEAVGSVLRQTFGDFEAVVIDDGSSDRTAEVVRSFSEPRIRYLHQANQGPSAATNTALAACRGKYIAFMSGDDVIRPDRLCKQLEAYGRGPTRVLFAGVEFIDDDGRPLEGDFYPEIIKEPNLTRARLFAQLFDSGPSFFGVTAFTERRVLTECGPDDPALFQTQDYARWIHLLKRYEFEVLPDRLYRFRIRTGWENLSGPQADKQIRARNEFYLVMKSFFRDAPTELFREAFRARLINPDLSDPLERACEEAFLYLRSPAHLNRLIGIERMHELLHDSRAGHVLKHRYQFDFLRFAEMLKTLDVTNMFAGQTSAVLVDQGDGWRPENIVRLALNAHVPQFSLVFDLERFRTPRIIAWAPFEEPRLGRVKVERFRCWDSGGAVHNLAPGDLSCHGCTHVGDCHIFDTTEPRLYFVPPGPVKYLEIAGRLELQTLAQTCHRLTSAAAEKQVTIDNLTRQVESYETSLWSRLRRRARRYVHRIRYREVETRQER